MNSEALIELISEQRRPEHYSYVLLDPLATPEDSEHSLLASLKLESDDLTMTRVVRPDLPHAPRLHPVLVCLAQPGSLPCTSRLELTVRAATGHDMHRRKRQVCGWLLSEAPPSVIAAHLIAMCRLPDASGATVFHPVYEPLRLELLAALYERVEHGPWWPIERWVFLTSGGRLASLKGQPHTRRGLPAGAIRTQQDAALTEALLSACRALPVFPGAREIPPFAAVHASNHIDVARGLGLNAEQDLLVLALHLLRLHARLHTQKAVRDMIDMAIRQQRPLAELFAHFSDSSWQRLVAALSQQEAYP